DGAGELGSVAVGIGGCGSHTLIGADLSNGFVKGGVTAAISGGINEAEIGLSFAVAGWINGIVSEEFDPVHRVGSAVEPAIDRGLSAAVRDRGDDWKVLQVVGAAIGVAGVMLCHSVNAEVDAEAGVGINGITLDGVVGAADANPAGKARAIKCNRIS